MEQPKDWRDEWRARRSELREQRRELRRQRRQAKRSEIEGNWEKTEKHEHMFMGPLIAGLVLVAFGALLFFLVVGGFGAQFLGALFFISVGVIIIAVATYLLVITERRHRRP